MCQLAQVKHDDETYRKVSHHNIEIKQTNCCIKSQTLNQVPIIHILFIMFILLSCSILCKQHSPIIKKKMDSNLNHSESLKDKAEIIGILSALDENSLRQSTSVGDKNNKIITSDEKRPLIEGQTNAVNLSPTRLLFEVENTEELNQPHDEEDEDEDFYIRNPTDSKTPDFDVESELKLNDSSDFNDFDDHKAYDTKNFYSDNNGNGKNPKNMMKPTEHLQNNGPKHKAILNSTKFENPSVHLDTEISDTLRGFLKNKSEKPGLVESVAQESYSSNSPQCALPLRSGICLTYDMIEWAIDRASDGLRFQPPPARALESPEPTEATINAIGELNEISTRILAQNFNLDWQEITFGLEQINMSQTSLWEICPAVFRTPPNCRVLTRYRTHSGQCNNLIAGHLGTSNMPFVRILPADYSDGVGAPRCSSFSGAQLPPARLVALSLHPDIENSNAQHSVLYMAWGQLLNHDLSLASGARGKLIMMRRLVVGFYLKKSYYSTNFLLCCVILVAGTGHGTPCCQRNRERVCMPIQIGADDPLYSQYGIRCHEFKRSLAGLRPGCSLGPRTQINTVTSFIDASFVYGSSRSMSVSLRRNNRGMLDTWNYFENDGLQALLPPQVDNPDEECVGRRNDGRFCFRSGDLRTNQQIQLVVLHTIHTRQHNRLAGALSRLNPHWTDNKLYHEARHIHIAIVQHILLNEFLPALLGPILCAKYNLTESPVGTYWDYYDPTINPGISQAFSAAAFRQGHSTVPNQVFRFNTLHEPRRMYQLRELFRQPWPLYEPGAIDEFLLGTVNAPAASFDPFIASDLSGHLLEVPEEPVGLDLTAINIQRGKLNDSLSDQ